MGLESNLQVLCRIEHVLVDEATITKAGAKRYQQCEEIQVVISATKVNSLTIKTRLKAMYFYTNLCIWVPILYKQHSE